MIKVILDGREYKVLDSFELGSDKTIVGELFAWAKSQIPDPLVAVKSQLLEFKDYPELQKAILDDALAQRRIPLTIQHPAISAQYATPEGAVKINAYRWRRHQPELTEEQAYALHARAVQEVPEYKTFFENETQRK